MNDVSFLCFTGLVQKFYVWNECILAQALVFKVNDRGVFVDEEPHVPKRRHADADTGTVNEILGLNQLRVVHLLDQGWKKPALVLFNHPFLSKFILIFNLANLSYLKLL